jgi:starch phosphorylase
MAFMKLGINTSKAFKDIIAVDPVFRSIAYFSMEVGIKKCIPTYAGGLGILAGDILKSAADLGVPMVGVTLLYRRGYFRQDIDEEGRQVEQPVQWDPSDEMQLLPNEIMITLEQRKIRVRVWVHEITGNTGYTIPVYFLDTDVEGNSDYDRSLTGNLYGGDRKYRLCQELVLGLGGLRILRSLGYNNLKKFHLNEGHAAFLVLEMLREEGFENFHKIREQGVFTTHTPVPAGHDHFPFEMVEKVMSVNIVNQLRKMLSMEGVSMTELGMRYCSFVNGVSRKHAAVSRNMFNKTDIKAITNGIHTNTWVAPEMKKVFDEFISGWENDPSRLVQAVQIPRDRIWEAHSTAKARLISYIEKDLGVKMDEQKLTIGFARRATPYKRADLIFSDLKQLLEAASGKVQLVFAGKAHPRDEGGKEIIQKIVGMADVLGDAIPMVYLENYDMEKGAMLTQGVDLWLNTPRRPREASGTSGMKCALNGVPNLSILDGWWIEGCVEGITGWAIGPEATEDSLSHYDETKDAEDLYRKLKKKVIPLYYENRDGWIDVMRNIIALNASYFNTHRVVREYCEQAYHIDFQGI